jgi:hypothetical protein
MHNDNTPHILNTSSNLLGLCFIIITYLRALGYSKQTMTDEIVGIAAVVFALSCLFSFLSMKNKELEKIERYEMIADISFFIGITIILIVIISNVFSIF